MVIRVTLSNSPQTVLAGSPTTFTCVTSASKPQACIRAYIRSSGNVRMVDPGNCNQDSNSVQTATRTLTFTAYAEENGAELYCNASNSVTDPPVRSQVYTLNVHFTPRINCKQSEVTVFQGQRIKIECDVTANPVARVSLVRNGNKMNSTFTTTPDPTRRDVTISTSEIEITKQMSSGIYQIEATNSAGSSWTEVEITLIESHFIPKTLKVISCINKKCHPCLGVRH
ncbi:cell adhesion molecule 2-like isoform X1 [Liolophura sinensis]|uniref:cell adhesion molecule 2-like isoform X1 n=1 Tax=Liolophura sinensis TaxID=3198878 RepID=UPI0031588B1E